MIIPYVASFFLSKSEYSPISFPSASLGIFVAPIIDWWIAIAANIPSSKE